MPINSCDRAHSAAGPRPLRFETWAEPIKNGHALYFAQLQDSQRLQSTGPGSILDLHILELQAFRYPNSIKSLPGSCIDRGIARFALLHLQLRLSLAALAPIILPVENAARRCPPLAQQQRMDL